MAGELIERKNGSNLLLIFVYVILGVYFVNYPLKFLAIPEVISKVDPWIIFVGGLLLFFGAINYFRVKRK